MHAPLMHHHKKGTMSDSKASHINLYSTHVQACGPGNEVLAA